MAKGRKTGGRVAGTPNKATADIKAAAQLHTDAMLSVLLAIAQDAAAPHAARVTAATKVLEFGNGKPAQAVELTGKDGGPVSTTVRFVDVPAA